MGVFLKTANHIKEHLKMIAYNSAEVFNNSSFLSKVKGDTHMEENIAHCGPSNVSHGGGGTASENIQVVQHVALSSNQPMVEGRESPWSPKRRRVEQFESTSNPNGAQMRGNGSIKAGDATKMPPSNRANDTEKDDDSCAKVPPNNQDTNGTPSGQTAGELHSNKGGAETELPPGQMRLHVNIIGGIPDRDSTMADVEQGYTRLVEVQINARNELNNLHSGISIQNVSVNSVIYTMRCDSLAALEFLWQKYETLELNKLITSITITEKTLKEVGALYLELQTTLDIEDYDKSKIALLSQGKKTLLLLLFDIDQMQHIIETAEMNAPVIFNSEECTKIKRKQGDILKLKMALTKKVHHILSCRPEILAILGVRRYHTVTDIDTVKLSDSELEGELLTNGTPILSITHPVSLQVRSLLLYDACPKQVKICNTCNYYLDLAQSVQKEMIGIKHELNRERQLYWEQESVRKINAEQEIKMSLLEKKVVHWLKEKPELQTQIANMTKVCGELEDENVKLQIIKKALEDQFAVVEKENLVLENQRRDLEEKLASSGEEIDSLKYKLDEIQSMGTERNINELQSKLEQKGKTEAQIKSVVLEGQSDSKLQEQLAVQELERDSTVEKEELKEVKGDLTSLSKADQADGTKRSVLILNEEWGTAKGGISSIHREISVLSKETGVDVYSAVLKAEDVDIEDTHQMGITLITPTINPNLNPDERNPSLSWFLLHKSFFPDLANIPNVKVIIGHAPITNEAAIQIKEDFPNAKVCLFNHVIPEDIEVFKDTWTPAQVQKRERQILDSAATAVFSVGPRVFDYFDKKFQVFNPAPLHVQYLPRLQNVVDVQMSKAKVKTYRVATFCHIPSITKLKGYGLLAAAMSEVAKLYHTMFLSAPVWVICGIPTAGNETLETQAFLSKNINRQHLDVKLYPYNSQEIIVNLKSCHLCITPTKSEPFGLVGLEAIAAGIPVLVAKHSGIAQYLERYFPMFVDGIVVDVDMTDNSKSEDIQKWRYMIIKVLQGYEIAIERAQSLKEELENCSAAKKSHEAFKKLIWQ